MFIITDYKDYLVGMPYREIGDFKIWTTKNINEATRYTLEECFEYFDSYPELKKENFTCIEVDNDGIEINELRKLCEYKINH